MKRLKMLSGPLHPYLLGLLTICPCIGLMHIWSNFILIKFTPVYIHSNTLKKAQCTSIDQCFEDISDNLTDYLSTFGLIVFIWNVFNVFSFHSVYLNIYDFKISDIFGKIYWDGLLLFLLKKIDKTNLTRFVI